MGIGVGTEIWGAIIDKNVWIGKNVRLVNEFGLSEVFGEGWVIWDGVIVVLKNGIICDDMVI